MNHPDDKNASLKAHWTTVPPARKFMRASPRQISAGRMAFVSGLTVWMVGACCPPGMAAGPDHGRRSDRAEKTATVATSDDDRGTVLEGRASYYHDSLAGNRTANGEIYDPEKLTAASRTLPFGTTLRVTRLDTGESVVVRVNDRGPFGRRSRILDLSRGAAEKLGMIRKGVIDVRAEIL